MTPHTVPSATRAELSRYRPAIVLGAALAGLAWGATGFVALLDPGPDPGPVGSSSFYLIEGGHALSETGMAVALFGLWRTQAQRIGRVGSVLFALAVTATSLLAVVTYVVVAGAALGFRPTEGQPDGVSPLLVALASTLFLFALVGIVAGWIGSGVATIRSGVWPPAAGWPLILLPFLLAANLVYYPAGILIGLAWLIIAWGARTASPPED